MSRSRLLSLLALGLLILSVVGGCDFFGTHEGVECLQDEFRCVETCMGEDTDMDGLFDCDDPDCVDDLLCDEGEDFGGGDYDGPPEGLVAGTTWQEERDGIDGEVYSGFTISDFSVEPSQLPPPAGIAQDLGAVSTALSENVLSGRIDSIVQGTWDGDNDAYQITFTAGGFVHFILEWDDPQPSDYDALLFCDYEDDSLSRAVRFIELVPRLDDVSVPEAGRTSVALVANWPCWFLVVGYSGSPGNYTVTIIPETGDPPVGDDDDSAGDDDDSAGV